MEHEPSPKEAFFRKLLHRTLIALGLSTLVNVFLFAFVFKELDDAGISFSSTKAEKQDDVPFVAHTLHEDLERYSARPYDELILLLTDTTPASDGYKVRDCALSVLVSKHYFAIDKALYGTAIQRKLLQAKGASFSIFPELTAEQHAKIVDFARTELYPFTFQGLFVRIQEPACDPQLKLACQQNRDYRHVEEQLIRDKKLSPDRAFELIRQARWNDILELGKGTFPENRRLFFEKLLEIVPKEAALAFVEVDAPYALHTLDDNRVLLLLEHLPEDSPRCKEYALAVYLSPRKSVVRKQAALKLCTLANLDPKTQTQESILKYFGIQTPQQKQQSSLPKQPSAKKTTPPIPQTSVSKAPAPSQAAKKKPSDKVHEVQSGETLWSIAKKYKVDVAALKKANGLKSETLRPGTKLRIPQ